MGQISFSCGSDKSYLRKYHSEDLAMSIFFPFKFHYGILIRADLSQYCWLVLDLVDTGAYPVEQIS